jgi:hypothetical protein
MWQQAAHPIPNQVNFTKPLIDDALINLYSNTYRHVYSLFSLILGFPFRRNDDQRLVERNAWVSESSKKADHPLSHESN